MSVLGEMSMLGEIKKMIIEELWDIRNIFISWIAVHIQSVSVYFDKYFLRYVNII